MIVHNFNVLAFAFSCNFELKKIVWYIFFPKNKKKHPPQSTGMAYSVYTLICSCYAVKNDISLYHNVPK